MLPTLMAATLIARLDIVSLPVAALVPVPPTVAALVAVPSTVVVVPVVPAVEPAPIATTPVLAVPATTGIPVTPIRPGTVRCPCIAVVVPVTPIRPVATVLTAVGVSSVAAVPTGAVAVSPPATAMTVLTTRPVPSGTLVLVPVTSVLPALALIVAALSTIDLGSRIPGLERTTLGIGVGCASGIVVVAVFRSAASVAWLVSSSSTLGSRPPPLGGAVRLVRLGLTVWLVVGHGNPLVTNDCAQLRPREGAGRVRESSWMNAVSMAGV